MPSIALTKRAVDELEQRASTFIVYDEKLAGFGVRVTPAGAKSFIVDYRPNGGGRRTPTRRLTIGSVSTVTADQARKHARDVLARVRLGQDPAAERGSRRTAATVSELIEKFLQEEIRPKRKPRTVDLYELYFRRHVEPELGAKKAVDVIRSDVARLHRHVGGCRKVTANRVVVLVGGLFSWATESGELSDDHPNPAKNIERFEEQGRERYLSSIELGRLGDALREAETVGLPWNVNRNGPNAKHTPKETLQVISPFAVGAIRLLLFTGARLREILNLRWDQVDFERSCLWLADSKTGRRPILINAPARAVLVGLPRIGECVIPGTDPDVPRHDLKKPWDAVSRRAGLVGVRLHDLRHTHASIGAGAGLGLPIIGKLLGHKQTETTARYAHLDADPLRRASDRIAGAIAAAMGEPSPSEGGEVVKLPLAG